MFRRLKQNCVLAGFAAFSAASAFGSAGKAAEDWEVIGDGVFPTGADLNAKFINAGVRICYWGGPGMWPYDGALATKVNGMGIDTYVVRDTYKQIPLRGIGPLLATTPYRTFNRNVFSAKFKPALLKVGENQIEPMEFPPNGVCHSTFWFVDAKLKSPAGREWDITRYDRTCLMCEISPPFEDKSVTLSLADIDPALVRYLENFQKAIMNDREALIANAADVADLAEALDRLDMVETEINDLVGRGLDELTPEYLNEVLQRYKDLLPESRNALVKLIEDRHKDVLDLRAELDRITSAYRTFEDTVVGLLGSTLAGAAFDPERVGNFLPPSLEDIPGVSVPIGSGTAFDPARDPYKAHANKVIATLRSYTADGKVVARAAYISLVRQWQRNQKALEASLKELRGRGSVSTAEWAAFLAARGLVTNEISGYLDLSDWFKDCPVPENLRVLVDGHLMRKDAELAVALKEALNEWKTEQITDEQRPVVDTLIATISGMEGLNEGDFESQQDIKAILIGATAFIKAGVGIALSFTPTGKFVDVCEAVTGYEFCAIGGAKLDTVDRVFSGLGAVVGSGAFWKAAGMALGVGGTAAVILTKTGQFAENLADLALAERKALMTQLGRTLIYCDDLRGKDIQRLAASVDEVAFHQLAPSLKGKGLQQLAAMRMFVPPPASATFARYHFQGDALAIVEDLRHGAYARQLPSFRNKPFAELEAHFWEAPGRLRNGWKNPMRTNKQIVYTHADGSVVRIAPEGTEVRQNIPHYKVEISKTPHDYAVADIVCKVADTGALIPANVKPSSVNGFDLPGADDLGVWLRERTGQHVKPYELDALKKVWGDAAHIDYIK